MCALVMSSPSVSDASEGDRYVSHRRGRGDGRGKVLGGNGPVKRQDRIPYKASLTRLFTTLINKQMLTQMEGYVIRARPSTSQRALMT